MGCLSFGEKLKIAFRNGRQNIDTYVYNLEPHLFKQDEENAGLNYVFQQDNASFNSLCKKDTEVVWRWLHSYTWLAR